MSSILLSAAAAAAETAAVTPAPAAAAPAGLEPVHLPSQQVIKPLLSATAALEQLSVIQLPKLPFTIHTTSYMPNSILQRRSQTSDAPPSPAIIW